MTPLHETRFYETLPVGKVVCSLCPHDCHVPDGARGGRLYALVYDRPVGRAWHELLQGRNFPGSALAGSPVPGQPPPRS